MAATLVRKVMLKIAADDGDTEAKLDAISRKADELAEKHPELKVKIDSAAASAKLAALRRELKSTDDTSVDAKTRLGALGEALNALTLGVSGGFGEMTMFQKAIAGLGIATGIGEPLIAGLTVAVGGLFSGLVAAGAGMGVFGLVAEGAYKQVEAADTAGTKLKGGLGDLQRGLASATSEWNKFVSANAGGVAKIMAQGLGLLPRLLSSIQPLLAPVEHALSGLVSQLGKGLDSSGFKSFMSMLAANTGPAITKLGQAIGHIGVGLGGIIRAFMPFAQEMLSGLDKITGAFAKWGSTLSQHSGFQSLMSTFKSETPQAVGVLKNLAVVIKNVVSAMTGMSTFSNSKMLLQVLGPLSGILAKLSKNTDLDRIALYLLAGADAGKKLKTAFQGIQGAMSVFKTGASAFQDLSSGFSNSSAAASDATGIWGTFGGKISSLGSMFQQAALKMGLLRTATVEGTEAEEGLDVAMEANPIGLIVVAIAGLVAAVVLLTMHCKAFRDFWKAAWKDIEDAGVAAWHFLDSDVIHPVMTGISDLVSWVKSHWKLLATILATVLLGPIGGLIVFIATHWQQFRSLTSRLVDDVVSFFERLPGRVMSAIGKLPGMLYNAGRNAIRYLISGLESMIGDVGSAVGGIASKVAGFFGLSPAKEGPLSGGGAPEIRGQHFAAAFAGGMTAGLPRISSAAGRLAGAATLGAAAGRPAAAAGGPMQIEWVGGQGDQQFMTWIKKNIRIRGGDVGNMGS